MISRLVLGCGTVGQRIVEQLTDRDGALLVIDDDEEVVAALREENVRARASDPADPVFLETLPEPAVVCIAGDEADRNRAVLDAASDRFPNAVVVVYGGANATEGDCRAMASLADHVVDPGQEVVAELLERTANPQAERALAVRRQLATIDGTLAVVMHDNPDPDAIASAVALCDLADAVGVEAEACYYGEISHQENRAMVNVLEFDLRNLDPDASLEEYAGFALVDHSRPGVNDGLPESLHVDLVIDHHPPRGPVPATFYDLREDVGATSTVLTEHLDRSGVGFDRRTATALLYGIRVDTNDFTREVSSSDFQAAAILSAHADEEVLRRIESPTVEGETFDTVARAIKNRIRRGSVVVASVGRIGDRDALPQAADQLLAIDGVDTTLVFGFIEKMVYVSARSRASDVDLGETLRDAYDQIGSAGGHANMAGAQLEIGILGEVTDTEQVDSIKGVVEEVITDRFFEAIKTRPGVPADAYDLTSEWLFVPTEGEGGESA